MTVDQYRRRITDMKTKANAIADTKSQINELQRKHEEVLKVELNKATNDLNKATLEYKIASL